MDVTAFSATKRIGLRAAVESFFVLLNGECVHRRHYRTPQEATSARIFSELISRSGAT
jgi:hypothetical protein